MNVATVTFTLTLLHLTKIFQRTFRNIYQKFETESTFVNFLCQTNRPTNRNHSALPVLNGSFTLHPPQFSGNKQARLISEHYELLTCTTKTTFSPQYRGFSHTLLSTHCILFHIFVLHNMIVLSTKMQYYFLEYKYDNIYSKCKAGSPSDTLIF